MSELIKRTLSGAVYVAVVVGSLLLYPNLYFHMIFCMMAVLAVKEAHLLQKDSQSMTLVSMTAAMLLFALATTIAEGDALRDKVMVAYGATMILGIVMQLFRKEVNPIEQWGHTLAAQVMIAVPFAAMPMVLHESKWLMLAVFVIIWVNDSAAYCVGSLMAKRKGGNHKMFPRVSPGKSWEGLIGGLVFALVAGYVFSIYVTEYAWWQWLLIALFIAGFGTLGDLIESLFKRTLGVKDSGKFMPGHGGVLDRFDSLLLATPAVWLLLLIL